MPVTTECPPLSMHYTAGGRRALARVASSVGKAARALADECDKVVRKGHHLDSGLAWHNDASTLLSLASICADQADALRAWGRPVPKARKRAIRGELKDGVPGLLAEIGEAVERGDLHAAKLAMGSLRFAIESMEGLGS